MRWFAARPIGSALVVWPLSLCAACTTATDVSIETPPLQDLEARQVPFRFRGRWGAIVTATLAGEALLAPHSRVPLTVKTSAGDVEELLLRPQVCESEAGAAYLCLEFMFSMREGHHVNEIASRVDALGAELRYVAHTGWFGSGVIFEGDVDPAISSVRTWSGVASASRVGLFTVQLTDVQAQALAVFARVEIAEAVPGDQSIQALAGDSVTMIYRPSVGMDLTAGFVMCEVVTTGDVLEGGLGDIPPCT